ncbi:FAD-dependent oxidoreductase [Streptomyces hirsutus]|uniref:FAD-dependent oxidoreductase n=1 Tax=Streptomyces hirsutus TaxID=35620 RepID=UPI00331DA000
MPDAAYSRLLSPVTVGSFTIPNRIMLTTHNPKLSEERYLKYLETRVAGGVGLVGIPVLHEAISTLAFVDTGHLDHVGVHDIDNGPDAETEEGDAYYDERLLPSLRARAEIVHRHGGVAFGQVANRGAIRLPETFQAMVSPSGLPDPQVRAQPHELSTGEVKRVVRLFARAASRVQRAGLDGVEIHATHGYLIEQFLSRTTNRRTDEYGGSLENRTRFLVETIAAIREACGPDFPIAMRISGHQAETDGLTTEEICRIVKAVEKDLVYVNITAGTIMALHDGVVLPYVASTLFEPGFNAEAAAAVKAAVSIPVGLTGRMNSPQLMERLLEEGVCDLIGTTRALLADPDFIRKTAGGRADRIHQCIGINECHYPDRASSCPVNPWAGREDELDLPDPVRRKKVLVIGGGPAGLMTARTAAQRGHDVVLAERSDRLGGKIATLVSDPFRKEMANLLGDLVREVHEAGVEVQLGREVGPGDIAAYGADALVVATGSVPDIPDMAGIDDVPVYSGLSLLEEDLDRIGDRVLVVGGLNDHVAPLAAADYLAQAGRSVTLISECLLPGQGAEPSILHLLTKRLHEKQVDIRPVTRFHKAGVEPELYDVFSGRISSIGQVDAVVFVTTSTPVPFPETAGEFYRVGDALAPRRLVHATLDGARTGSRI